MSASERRKGAGGELEVVTALYEHGWGFARRTHDGREQALRGDIANGPAGTHIEVKRSERAEIWSWLAQAEADAAGTGHTPIVAFRRNRSGWVALIELEELLALLALRQFS